MPEVKFEGNLWGYRVFSKVAKEAAEETLDKTLLRAKAVTPVDTGFLRSSWEGKVRPGKITFVNPADYASYVFFGTRFMRARPQAYNEVMKSPQEFQKIYLRKLARKVVRTVTGL